MIAFVPDGLANGIGNGIVCVCNSKYLLHVESEYMLQTAVDMPSLLFIVVHERKACLS